MTNTVDPSRCLPHAHATGTNRTHVAVHLAFGSDLPEEKAAVAKAIERLNKGSDADALWFEIHHAGLPMLGLDESPIAGADVVIVVLGNTLDGADGFAPAVEAYLASGKPQVLLYQCTRPPARNASAMQASMATLAAIDGLSKKPPEFGVTQDLADAVMAHLPRLAQRAFSGRETAPVQRPADLSEWLDAIESEHGFVRMSGLRGADQVCDQPLLTLYVPLDFDRRDLAPPAAGLGRLGGSSLVEALKREAEDAPPTLAAHEGALREAMVAAGVAASEIGDPAAVESLWARLLSLGGDPDARAVDRVLASLPAERALQRSPLLIEGAPGSGKTTTLKAVAMALVEAHRGQPEAARALGFKAPWPLPLFVPLRSFARHLGDRRSARPRLADLMGYVCERAEEAGAWLPQALEQGDVVVLLDALDEIADAGLRDRSAELIRQFIKKYPANHFLLSTRPKGLTPGVRNALLRVGRLTTVAVRDLEAPQRARIVEKWFEVVTGRGEHARAEAAAFLARLNARPKVVELAVNPLIVTALLVVGRDDMPERRVELYERCIEALAHNWDLHRPEADGALTGTLTADEKIEILMSAGWTAQTQGKTDQVIAPRPMFELVRAAVPNRFGVGDAGPRALIDHLAERSGLLQPEGEGYRFRHLQFQEYLAARSLCVQGRPDLTATQLRDSFWREVVVLAIGYRTWKQHSAGHGWLAALAEHTDGLSMAHLAVARAALAEALLDLRRFPGAANLPALGPKLSARFAEVLEHADQPGAFKDRVYLGDALGVLGDPRLDPSKRWVELEGGEFWSGVVAGDAEAASWERPGGWATVSDFAIQRWPVTVAEWAEFIEGGGYDDAWWSDPGRSWRDRHGVREPSQWDEQQARRNGPVVGVSWWEAQAYCAWLSARDGVAVTLPTQDQWVRAARGLGEGGATRIFPWVGPWRDDAATSATSEAERATPVGLHPSGVSVDGVWDLSGNVWEWSADDGGAAVDRFRRKLALSDAQLTEYGWLDANGTRVLRGGCWVFGPRFLRVSYRYVYGPGGRSDVVGFRCVRAPALRS